MIRQLIKSYCDCFVEEGAKIPILGFEFVIDIDKYTYLYCKKLHYGPHESRIITKQLKILLTKGLIERCVIGGWGSPIVLAPKSYHEYINMVENLVWWLCISYLAI